MKDRYTVGEFGEMFRLNVQTLRYYDSIGLFRPKHRDERTGRRSYAFEQVYGLASIRFLRRLGYSLEDVQDYLNQRQAEDTLEILKKRSADLRRQLEELQDLDNAIRRKIRYTEAALTEVEERGGPDSITVHTIGQRRYIPIGEEELLYNDDSFYLYPTVVFYEGTRKTFGAYLYQEEDGQTHANGSFARNAGSSPGAGTDKTPSGFSIRGGTAAPTPAPAAHGTAEVIPAGEYLCGYHRGPYEQVHETDARLRAAHPELALSDETIDFNIVDQFVERDSDNYLTGMQIRIVGRR